MKRAKNAVRGTSHGTIPEDPREFEAGTRLRLELERVWGAPARIVEWYGGENAVAAKVKGWACAGYFETNEALRDLALLPDGLGVTKQGDRLAIHALMGSGACGGAL